MVVISSALSSDSYYLFGYLGTIYASRLYIVVADQPPLRDLLEPCPLTSAFFIECMVREAIERLSAGKAQDCIGLVAEHLIYARDTLSRLVAFMFYRAMWEGFPESWSTNAIVPLHKLGDPTLRTNYPTIVVGHLLAKLHASIIDELSQWVERVGLRA